MSRLAVKTYCSTQLAGLNVPGNCTVLQQRPKVVDVGAQALIVVEIPKSKESRFTMPRTTGNKKIEHGIQLVIHWIDADEQTGGQVFDDLLEQIDKLFRAAPLPASLTDQDTGATSTLLFVGEDIETDVREPLQDDSVQGLVVFSAVKFISAVELAQG